MKLVTTDSGKKFCKGTDNGIDILRFTSRIDMLKDADYNYKNLIEIGGKYYVLGDEAKSVSYNSSKEEILHKLSVYYNVCKHVNYGERVNLVVNMPITHFMDVKQRERFKDYIFGDGDVQMKIGHKEYLFCINKVLVVAEGTGVIFQKPELFKDKSAIICNVGGLNSTCLQVNNKKIVKDSPFISNWGGNILETNIRTELNRNGRYNFQPHEIPYLFESEDDYIRDAIDYCSEEIFDNIITDMKSHNYNVAGSKIYFEGGTSLRFKDMIEDAGFTLLDDPINLDIKGSHLYGVKKLG